MNQSENGPGTLSFPALSLVNWWGTDAGTLCIDFNPIH